MLVYGADTISDGEEEMASDTRRACSDEPVSVLGCGMMGTALVRALAASGHATTVWNRTESKARALAEPGRVTVAASVTDAVAVSPVVLLIVSDYASAAACIDSIAEPTALAGRAVVNLISGTPEAATELEKQV